MIPSSASESASSRTVAWSTPGLLRDLLGIRHTYVLLTALLLAVAQILTGGWLVGYTSAVTLTTYGLLFGLLLRPKFWPVALAIGLLVDWFLNFANNTKIALTQMPVTFIDFAILVKDPRGFSNALQLSGAEILALLGGTAAVVLTALWVLLHTCVDPRLEVKGGRAGAALFQTGSIVLFLAIFWAFTSVYVRSVHEYLQRAKFAWNPVGVTKLSHQLGVGGFILYSYALDKSETGLFFTGGLHSQPPDPGEIAQAAQQYVHLHAVPPAKLPNIMVVLGESTFDVNQAFKLKQPVSNYLFERNEDTRALGPVYANAVGGGTWLSEFETVVGINERLFGYAGYYTHASLSPFVKQSFATYLEGKGYSTITFYPTEGSFYNARNAFKNYGFQQFFDSADLRLREHWRETDDEIAKAVVSSVDLKKLRAPFFAYVDFLENHVPHKCDKFTDESQFFTTFKDPASFEQNCILNEYVRRARSSETGFRKLVGLMQDTERRTGRPYVIMIFGDHQPRTFTSKTWSQFDYGSYRTKASVRQTFFHVISSVPDVIDSSHLGIPHLSLLPTLLSAYTAARPEDLYLGVNFYAYENCGADLSSTRSSGVYASTSPKSDAGSKTCGVLDKVLSSYHQSHIF